MQSASANEDSIQKKYTVIDSCAGRTHALSRKNLVKFRRTVLDYQLYSADLSLYNFHIFTSQESSLKYCRFYPYSKVMDNVQTWLRFRPKNLYDQGVNRLVKLWDKCFCSFRNYVSNERCNFTLWLLFYFHLIHPNTKSLVYLYE